VRHAQALVDAWGAHGEPRPVHFPARYNWMDGVLLRTLAVNRVPGAAFFTRLFERNPMTRVLAFLDEETGVRQDLALMASVDVPRFAHSALEVSWRRAWHARRGRR
jgi:lycopene beta-cyclase